MIEPYQAQLIGYTIVAVIFTVFGLEQYLKIKRRFFPKTPGKVNQKNGTNNKTTTTNRGSKGQNEYFDSRVSVLELRVCNCNHDNNPRDRPTNGNRSKWNERGCSWSDRNGTGKTNYRGPKQELE